MRVRIYHSIDERFMFRRWEPGAALKLVDDYLTLGWRQGEHPDSQVSPGITRMAYGEEELVKLAMGQLPEEILELIYRDQNAVDGDERNVRMRNRSLSVGDVVMLNDRAFAVASVGFEAIDANQMLAEVVA